MVAPDIEYYYNIIYQYYPNCNTSLSFPDPVSVIFLFPA
jgi:hypothetical protein